MSHRPFGGDRSRAQVIAGGSDLEPTAMPCWLPGISARGISAPDLSGRWAALLQSTNYCTAAAPAQ